MSFRYLPVGEDRWAGIAKKKFEKVEMNYNFVHNIIN